MYSHIRELIYNTIEEAKLIGFNLSTPKKLRIIGSTILGDLETPFVDVVVSYAMPADQSVLWINPANRSLNKYKNGWYAPVYKYRADLFRGEEAQEVIAANTATSLPVQTTTDLSAISTTTLEDKTIIYVEDTKSLYAYDATSQDAGSDTIIVPDSGVGRWYLIAAPNLIGNADGGSF